MFENTTAWEPVRAEPDFRQLLKVLRCEPPGRPTLFEFFLNARLYARLSGRAFDPEATATPEHWRTLIAAFRAACWKM